ARNAEHRARTGDASSCVARARRDGARAYPRVTLSLRIPPDRRASALPERGRFRYHPPTVQVEGFRMPRAQEDGSRNLRGTFDLNLLTVAVALHDCGSVTRAAESLSMSQPAVSMALNRLRSAVGDPLFVRGAAGMTPTPRASRLVASVRPLIAQVQDGLRDEEFDAASTRTTFTFAMSDVGEMVFLPPLLSRIQRLAPNAKLRTLALKPRELERALEHGEVDVAIGYFPDLHGKSFMQQRLFSHH